MSIMEPLEVLLPAFENLLPLEGDLDLGISCGILELSETVRLAVSDGNATITRDGIIIDLTLPGEVSELSPAAAALLLCFALLAVLQYRKQENVSKKAFTCQLFSSCKNLFICLVFFYC